MKLSPVWLASLLLASALCAQAQDTVTIPKSRLEELERKEAELKKLQQGGTNAPAAVNAPDSYAAPQVTTAPGTVKPANVAPPRHTKPIETLPPLKAGEVVDSIDLASQFRAEPALADKRYKGQKLVIRGEIVSFEQPILRSNYRILLQGPDRVTSVVCDLLRPEKFSAVFPADHGTQLIGQWGGENRTLLARLGQVVFVRGRCRGWKGNSVFIVADSFELAQ